MLDTLLQDLRYAWRSVARSRALSATVIGTMALAIGANTALFSIFNGLVLKTMPVHDPERLVTLNPASQRVTGTQMIYKATLDSLRASQGVFTAMTLYSGGGALRVEARGVETDGGIEGVEPAYFDMVGARPQLGRLLQPADAIEPTGAPVLVISDRLWQRLFARDARAVGEQILVNATPLTIVGVLDASFRGLQTDVGADLFMTMATLRPIAGDMTRPLRGRNVIAQLRPGVTVDEARRAMQAQWPAARAASVPGLPQADADLLASQQVLVESIATGYSPMRDQYATTLSILMALTALLLAIGCANISGLLLARAVARNHETAIRTALGAGRWRLIQHVLVETVTLAALGMAAAVPLAWWTTLLLQRALTAGSFLPPALRMTPDARVFGVSAATALLTGAIMCLLPAWHAVRTPPGTLTGDRTTVTRTRTARVLLVGQVALSLMLLVAASLFARSLSHLRVGEAPYRPEQIVWSRLWLKVSERRAAAPQPTAYWTDLGQRFASLPGVSSVAYATNFPVFLAAEFGVERIEAVDRAREGGDVGALFEAVSPGFFQTIGVPLLGGRDIAWTDTRDTTPVAIVTQALAVKLFPDGEAVGHRVRVVSRGAPQPFDVIGVVADAAFRRLDEPHQPALFRAFAQDRGAVQQPIMLVRTQGDAAAVFGAFEHVGSTTRHFVRRVAKLDEYVDEVLLRERLITWLSLFFAGVAVLLSCMGIYGLLAYSVGRRTREIGIRMALGATPAAVVRAIAREGFWVSAAGLACGVPGALAAGPFIRSLLHGLEASDARTMAGACVLFLTLTVIAGLVPTYRAARIDPTVALRQQ